MVGGKLFTVALLGATCAFAQESQPPMPICSAAHPRSAGLCVVPPKVTYRTDPSYTEEAVRAGLEGTVRLRLLVTPEGLAGEIQVTKGLGMGMDQQAVEAVRQWRFEPARIDGKAIATKINIEINFHLPQRAGNEPGVSAAEDVDGSKENGSGEAGQFYQSGLASFRAKDYEAAAKAWRRTVELDPTHAKAWNQLCRADYELKKFADAEAACRKQLSIDPEDKYAHNNLGRALWAQSKLDEAGEEFRKQIAVNTQDRWAHANLGMLLAKQGKCSAAIPELEIGYRLDPRNEKASDALRQCRIETGQAEKTATMPLYAPNPAMGGGVLGGFIGPTPGNASKEEPARVHVAPEVAKGLLLKKVPPVYPESAKQARIQGTVALQAVISPDGHVTRLKMISGHPMLVAAAADAVRQWEYTPYRVNGTAVEVETQITVNFALAELK